MRFQVLDALRGVCALVVVVFHIEIIGGIYAGALHGVPFFEHGFFLVDFFFVLSGFVLTHSYLSHITTASDLTPFIIRRFGRVYPLHIFFLALFIGLELVKYYASLHGVHANKPPFGELYSVQSIFTNILLIQALGVHDTSTWNGPAWSISVEFYTYIVFALCAYFLHAHKWAFVAVAACISAFGAYMVFNYSRYYIDTVYDFAIFRCVFGFFCGSITYVAMTKIRGVIVAPAWAFFAAETAIVLACIAFVTATDTEPRSLGAPLIFSAAIAVFSFEKGWLSWILTKWPFPFFGNLSYTVYISHAFILVLIGRILHVAQQKSSYFPAMTYHYHSQPLDLVMPVSPGVSNIVVAAILAAIVALCVVVNRWVEVPARDYFARAAKSARRNCPQDFSAKKNRTAQ